MLRCAERFPTVNIALSLHSVDQQRRQQIIPLAKVHPLPELQDALRLLNRVQQREVMIEYLMLAGVNDSDDDAHSLINWLDGIQCHVNLIPYNAIEDAPELRGSDRSTIRTFADCLKSSGIKTTVRYSLGNDIAAACGQLVRRENRAHAMNLSSNL